MTKKKLRLSIADLKSPANAASIERYLKTLPTISRARVSFGTGYAFIELNDYRLKSSDVVEQIAELGFRAVMEEEHIEGRVVEGDCCTVDIPRGRDHAAVKLRDEQFSETDVQRNRQRLRIFLYLGGILFGAMALATPFIHLRLSDSGRAIITIVTTILAVLALAAPLWRNAFYELRQLRPGQSMLYIMAILLGATYISIHPSELAVVEIVLLLAALAGLQDFVLWRISGRAVQAINVVQSFQPETAELQTHNGRRVHVLLKKIAIGSIVAVRPGERFPLDGKIIDGHTMIDESLLSGEGIPRERSVGDFVVGGTLNKTGYVKIETTATADHSFIAQLVERAQHVMLSRLAVQKKIERVWQGVFPITFVAAVIYFGVAVAQHHAVPVQVVIQICTIFFVAAGTIFYLPNVIALQAATSNAVRRGIIFHSAENFALAAQAPVVGFTDFGVITKGAPRLAHWHASNRIEAAIFAASFARHVEDNFAAAIFARALHDNLQLEPVRKLQLFAPNVVTGEIRGRVMFFGPADLFQFHQIHMSEQQKKIAADYEADGGTVFFLATSKEVMGIFCVQDDCKPDLQPLQQALIKLHKTSLLFAATSRNAALVLAKKAGFVLAKTGLAPSAALGSLAIVTTAGTNPMILRAAKPLILLGAGTATPLSHAGIVILDGALAKVATIFTVSNRLVRVVRQNIAWGIVATVLLLAVAVLQLIPAPVVLLLGVLAVLAAAFHALRLLQ